MPVSWEMIALTISHQMVAALEERSAHPREVLFPTDFPGKLPEKIETRFSGEIDVGHWSGRTILVLAEEGTFLEHDLEQYILQLQREAEDERKGQSRAEHLLDREP
jgi:hypothetical protein